MYKRHELGKNGEDIACDFILKMGYDILERNYRSKLGEIDIIAKDNEELVLIEVKTRGQELFGTPAEAVNPIKRKHIYHVAEYYLMERKLENVFCRIDIVEIYKKGDKYNVNYIKNAVTERPK